MGNRIVGLIFLILVCVGGYFAWQHYHEQKLENSGDFTCQGCMSPDEKARFDKENSGDTSDGQSEHKLHTAAQDAKAGFPDADAPVNGTPGTKAGATAPPQTYPPAQTSTQTSTQTATTTMPASQPTTQTSASPMAQPATSAAGPLPTTDSQSANAPNGMRFGGSGAYQWYRQGNLTWRIDTTTGRSCIIYATMEEWQKQIVMSHGCGRAA